MIVFCKLVYEDNVKFWIENCYCMIILYIIFDVSLLIFKEYEC